MTVSDHSGVHQAVTFSSLFERGQQCRRGRFGSVRGALIGQHVSQTRC